MPKQIVAAILLLLFTSVAQAIDGISVEAGSGNATTVYKLALHQSWDGDCAFLTEHNLLVYGELSVADIEGKKYRDVEGQQHSLIDFGLTPIVRWQGADSHGLFAEIGIGANYFTHIYDNNGRTFSSNFQFGDHFGIGYKFNKTVEVTFKFQHFSNADIKKPNPGFNAGFIKLFYGF